MADLLRYKADPGIIERAQRTLKTLGFYEGEITGVFDTKTDDAFSKGVATIQQMVNVNVNMDELFPGGLDNLKKLDDIRAALNIAEDGYYGPDTHGETLKSLKDGILSRPQFSDLAEFARVAAEMSEQANANRDLSEKRIIPNRAAHAKTMAAEVREKTIVSGSYQSQAEGRFSFDGQSRIDMLRGLVGELETQMIDNRSSITARGDPPRYTQEFNVALSTREAMQQRQLWLNENGDFLASVPADFYRQVEALKLQESLINEEIDILRVRVTQNAAHSTELLNDEGVSRALVEDTLKHNDETFSFLMRRREELNEAQEEYNTLVSPMENGDETPPHDNTGIDGALVAVERAQENYNAALSYFTEKQVFNVHKAELQVFSDATLQDIRRFSELRNELKIVQNNIDIVSAQYTEVQQIVADIDAAKDRLYPVSIDNDLNDNIAIAPVEKVAIDSLDPLPGIDTSRARARNLEEVIRKTVDPNAVQEALSSYLFDQKDKLLDTQEDIVSGIQLLHTETEGLEVQRQALDGQERDLAEQVKIASIQQSIIKEELERRLVEVEEIRNQRDDLVRDQQQELEKIENSFGKGSNLQSPELVALNLKLQIVTDKLTDREKIIDTLKDQLAQSGEVVANFDNSIAILRTRTSYIVNQSAALQGRIAQEADQSAAVANRIEVEELKIQSQQALAAQFWVDSEVVPELSINDFQAIEVMGGAQDFSLALNGRDAWEYNRPLMENGEKVTEVETAAPLSALDRARLSLGLEVEEKDVGGDANAELPVSEIAFPAMTVLGGNPAKILVAAVTQEKDIRPNGAFQDSFDRENIWVNDLRNLQDTTPDEQRISALRYVVADLHNTDINALDVVPDIYFQKILNGETIPVIQGIEDENLEYILNNPFNLAALNEGQDSSLLEHKGEAIVRYINDLPGIDQQDLYNIIAPTAEKIATAGSLESISGYLINDDPYAAIDMMQQRRREEFSFDRNGTYDTWLNLYGGNNEKNIYFADALGKNLREGVGNLDDLETSIASWQNNTEKYLSEDDIRTRADILSEATEAYRQQGNNDKADITARYAGYHQNILYVFENQDKILEQISSLRTVNEDPAFAVDIKDGASSIEITKALIAGRNGIEYSSITDEEIQSFLDKGTVSDSLAEKGVDQKNIFGLSASLSLDNKTPLAEQGALHIKQSYLLDQLKAYEQQEGGIESAQSIMLDTIMLSNYDVALSYDGRNAIDVVRKLENIATLDQQADRIDTLLHTVDHEQLKTPEGMMNAIISVKTGLPYNVVAARNIGAQPEYQENLQSLTMAFNANTLAPAFAVEKPPVLPIDVQETLAPYNLDVFVGLATDSAQGIIDGKYQEALSKVSFRNDDELYGSLSNSIRQSTEPESVQYLYRAAETHYLHELDANELYDLAAQNAKAYFPDVDVENDRSRNNFLAENDHALRNALSDLRTLQDENFDLKRLIELSVLKENIGKMEANNPGQTTFEANEKNVELINGADYIIYGENKLFLDKELERLQGKTGLKPGEINPISLPMSEQVQAMWEKLTALKESREELGAQIKERGSEGMFGKFTRIFSSEPPTKDMQERYAHLEKNIDNGYYYIHLQQAREKMQASLAQADEKVDVLKIRQIEAIKIAEDLNSAKSMTILAKDEIYQRDLTFLEKLSDTAPQIAVQNFVVRGLISAGNGIPYSSIHITDEQTETLLKTGVMTGELPEGIDPINPFGFRNVSSAGGMGLSDDAQVGLNHFLTKKMVSDTLLKIDGTSAPSEAVNLAFYGHRVLTASDFSAGLGKQDIVGNLETYAKEAQQNLSNGMIESQTADTMNSYRKMINDLSDDTKLSSVERSQLQYVAKLSAVVALDQRLDFDRVYTGLAALSPQQFSALLSADNSNLSTLEEESRYALRVASATF